ncbi:MAG TPA: translation initiation factor IF-3 [Patescibacteria group bacterium]|nr:translation initiation factor IF-3 [Patescibacteria group bacterium]
MIKRFHKRQDTHTVYYRINERIQAQELRVLDSENKQVGVLSKMEALQRARDEGLDLVEIAPSAKPPVAKIVDYKKFLYQQEKKKREEKKKAKVTETKEVRLGPFMDDHDLQIAASRAKGFLEDGDKVRFVVKFRGRQITRPQFGFEVISKISDILESVSKMEREPKLEGRQIMAILSPERKKDAKEENQTISE